jgi:hypothetical protein
MPMLISDLVFMTTIANNVFAIQNIEVKIGIVVP